MSNNGTGTLTRPFDGVRQWIGKALGYRLGSPQGAGGFRLFEMDVPPGWGHAQYLRAYGEIGWLYACVNVIAQAVAKVPWHLYTVNPKGERTEIIRHDLLDLMHHTNPFQTWYQFLYLAQMYKSLLGEEFWLLNVNGRGKPAEIWLAPPTFMSVVPSETEYISHYEYRRNNYVHRFEKEEIIHILTPNPANPYRGLSPAQALTTDLDSERYASKYQQKLFFNDATPGFVLEYPADHIPTKDQRDELMMEWDSRFKGFRNRGKTAFLFGAKANTLTMSNRDMDFELLRKYNRDAILGAYHVPKSVLGVVEDVNRANSEAAIYTFAQWVVHPELCQLREALNMELVPQFGSGMILDFENPVPEDRNALVTNAVNLFKAGIVTRNDALAIVGMDTVEGPEGDEYAAAPANPFALPEPKWLKGGSGSGNFDHGGRPGELGGSGPGGSSGSARSERAKLSHKTSTASVQRQAEGNEPRLAAAIGGTQGSDNEAFDVRQGKNAIEVKTIVRGSNDKITMHPESLRRKQELARSEGLKMHTVAFDDRVGKIYYREGVGSFRLKNMTPVGSLGDLKVMIG